jgi:LAO/AO transport system kinase
MSDLVRGILAGEMRAIARTISLIENQDPRKEEIVDSLFVRTGRAVIVGITGPPGGGKSSLVDRLVLRERRRERRVAVIAVDPSSPFSGGALLGDRLRMQSHATDEGVFIRSMASRGHLGGIAEATGDVIKVLDAAGFDTIFIETIGVGQTEVEIVELSDLVLLVLVPGMGDEIQAMKAGVMEIGDLFVINKKDQPGADKLKAEVEYVLGIKYNGRPEAINPIVMVSALHDDGIDELVREADGYYAAISAGGLLESKRRLRIARELHKIFSKKVHDVLDVKIEFSKKIEEWVDLMYNRSARPYELINREMKSFLKEYR